MIRLGDIAVKGQVCFIIYRNEVAGYGQWDSEEKIIRRIRGDKNISDEIWDCFDDAICHFRLGKDRNGSEQSVCFY